MSRKRLPRRGGMVRNVIHLGLGQAASTVLVILLYAVVARTLSAADFGLFYLATSISTFAYVVVDWGHGSIIIRETARHPDEAGNLLGSALAVRTAFALGACVAVYAATWLLGYDAHTRLVTVVVLLALLPQYLGLSFGWVFRGYEQMSHDAVLNVALKVAVLLGSIGCIALGGRLLGLVFTLGLAGCVTLVIGIVMYRRLHLPPLSVSMSTARELLSKGSPLLAMSLAVAIEPFINANILYKMSPPEVVGWFGAAWNIAGTLLAPATIIAATMFPRLSTAAADPAEFKRVFDISFRPLLLSAILGAAGTYLFADVAVGTIYTLQKFGPAVTTLRAFVPVLLLMYVDVFLANAIVAAGKAGRLAGSKLIAVILTTALALILVPFCQARFGNGGLGVMYAMALGELVMLVAAGLLLREAIDRRTIGELCRGLLAGAGTVFVVRLLPGLTPFLAIPLCVLLFGAIALLVGAARRSDVEILVAYFRKRAPVPAADR